MLLFEITDAFEKRKLPYAVVGGFALALHGIVRATMDVDLIINFSLKDFEAAEATLQGIGLQSRLPVRGHEIFKMRQEYIKQRNLIAWSFVDYKDPCRMVDVIITRDRRTTKVVRISTGGRKVSVASLESLLEMKLEAGRPQDMVDIERIRARLNG